MLKIIEIYKKEDNYIVVLNVNCITGKKLAMILSIGTSQFTEVNCNDLDNHHKVGFGDLPENVKDRIENFIRE